MLTEELDELINKRKRSDVTQAQVAERMGVAQSVVSRIENKTGNPTFATIEAYDATVSILLATPTVEEIQNFSQRIADDFDLAGVTLFGSYARGTQTLASDIDLLVLSHSGEPLSFETLYAIEKAVEGRFGIEAHVTDYATIKSGLNEDYRSQRFMLRVLNDKKVLVHG